MNVTASRRDSKIRNMPMRRWVIAVLALLLLASLAAAQKKPPAQPININTAAVDQLVQLPGVGRSMARSIIAFREKHGPFRRVEELLIVRGISRARLRIMRPYIRVK